MKQIIIIVFILFVGFQSVAQEIEQFEDDNVYTFVQQKAVPREGLGTFFKSFSDKLKTEDLNTSVSELRFILRFIVEKDGAFSDIKVVNDILNLKWQKELLEL